MQFDARDCAFVVRLVAFEMGLTALSSASFRNCSPCFSRRFCRQSPNWTSGASRTCSPATVHLSLAKWAPHVNASCKLVPEKILGLLDESSRSRPYSAIVVSDVAGTLPRQAAGDCELVVAVDSSQTLDTKNSNATRKVPFDVLGTRKFVNILKRFIERFRPRIMIVWPHCSWQSKLLPHKRTRVDHRDPARGVPEFGSVVFLGRATENGALPEGAGWPMGRLDIEHEGCPQPAACQRSLFWCHGVLAPVTLRRLVTGLDVKKYGFAWRPECLPARGEKLVSLRVYRWTYCSVSATRDLRGTGARGCVVALPWYVASRVSTISAVVGGEGNRRLCAFLCGVKGATHVSKSLATALCGQCAADRSSGTRVQKQQSTASRCSCHPSTDASSVNRAEVAFVLRLFETSTAVKPTTQSAATAGGRTFSGRGSGGGVGYLKMDPGLVPRVC